MRTNLLLYFLIPTARETTLNIILNYIIVTIANEHVGVHFFQQFSRVRLLVHCFFTENRDFKVYETLAVMTVYYFKYVHIFTS